MEREGSDVERKFNITDISDAIVCSEDDTNMVTINIKMVRRRFESQWKFQGRIYGQASRLAGIGVPYWEVGWLDANCGSYGFTIMFFAGKQAYFFAREK